MSDYQAEKRIIVESNSSEHIQSCSLVLTAVGIYHEITNENKTYYIAVEEYNVERATYHLESYISENKNWPPPQQAQEYSESKQPPTLLVVSALILFYGVTGPWSNQSHWFKYGMGDAGAILADGEYFRLVTALTLHADVVHLLGNCLLGGFIIHFFCRIVGSGVGLFAITLSATLGNYINVYLHQTDHLFVGFSTAVFSTIGMLSMIRYHTSRKLLSYHIFAPLMAGVALLAMTGSSGERTDLGAHFFGLGSGFLIGWLLNTDWLLQIRRSSFAQFLLFCTSISIIWVSWNLALDTVY